MKKDEVLEKLSHIGSDLLTRDQCGQYAEQAIALITTLASENERLQADNKSWLEERLKASVALAAQTAELAALRQKVAELEAKVPRWIPISERLPENSVKRVIYLENDGKTGVCEFPSGWNGMLAHDYITHWMPLPTTPQETKE